jgi:hypothetical protein
MRKSSATRFGTFAAALFGLVASGWLLTGRAATPVRQGFPTDWTHHHVIFSRPANARAAARVQRDARYWQQFARRNVPRVVSEDGYNGIAASLSRLAARNPSRIHRDWAENMGSGAAVGVDNYPAKYTFQTTTANCGTAAAPDFVIFNTGLTGSSTQASIVAFDNLYSGCGGTVPQSYWAYNTGAQILTSPTISLDGTQASFVQSIAGQAQLVLLKWKASTGTIFAPVTPTAVASTAYRACTAPCMTTIPLRSGLGTIVDDTTSSVFPDYSNDTLYVGGSLGWLHKITGAFLGLSPKEITTGGFPVQVNPSNTTALSSPVFDGTSVFVGDYGGYFYRVNPTNGAVVRTAQLDHGAGLAAGPYVDTTANIIYVFASSDGTTNCVGATPCSAVYVLSSSFAANATGTKVTVGSAGTALTPNVVYNGDFDSTYQNSVNATGNLYVCGNTGGPPVLYKVPIAAGVPGTPVAGPVLANATTGCSTITDIYNSNTTGAATEWAFVSVQTSGLGSNCSSLGCVFGFKITPRLSSTAYAVGQTVLDNNFQIQVVTSAGTSGASAPTWSTTVGGSTTDGGVKWFNQGTYNASIAPWVANTGYLVGNEVLDSNGKVQQCTKAGTSNATAPTWTAGAGGNTAESGNGPHWVNLGSIAIANAFASGGASGIILDNTLPSTTLAGASQIYFSTQANQNCATSGGNGGCAVQVSQAALQ